jgi:hypothetical protein
MLRKKVVLATILALAVSSSAAHAADIQRLEHVLEVDKSVDRSEQVVGGEMPFGRELIEQRSLFDLPMSHHDLQSCQLDRLNH